MDFSHIDPMLDATLDDLSFDLDMGNTRVKKLRDKHLSSPVITTFIERCIDQYGMAVRSLSAPIYKQHILDRMMEQARNTRLETSGVKWKYSRFLDLVETTSTYPAVLQACSYPKLFNYESTSDSGAEYDLETALTAYKYQIDAICGYLSPVLRPDEETLLKAKLCASKRMKKSTGSMYSRAALFSRLVDEWRQQERNDQYHSIEVEGITLIPTREMAAIRWNTEDYQLIAYEQLQMIQDALLSRANVLFQLDFGLHNGDESLRELVLELIEWQENVITSLGNDGYELVKAPEALCKCYLTHLSRGDILKRTSFSRMIEKLHQKEVKLHSSTVLIDSLVKLVKKTSSINNTAELFGLIKLSGHPQVYADRSGRSVQKEACTNSAASPSSIVRVTRNVKHVVLSSYLSEHSEWPPFSNPPVKGTKLYKLFKQRATTLRYSDYSSSDLDYVKFGKFVEFDYSEDYLKFLDDKAICPGASETPKFWFGGSDPERRRLLLHALKMKGLDTRELVERMRRGKTTRDEEIIELTQKEREFKTEARCFAKLPFEPRCFFTLTEYNLGEHIMPKYIPLQSMTMSDAETKNKLWQMSQSTKNLLSAILEIDFSRWNLKWRSNTVDPISAILEEIVGLPGVFSVAHSFFNRCTVVVTDRDNPPRHANPSTSIHDWEECDMLWRGHQGGFEGIQQKLWTICTIGLIYQALEGLQVSFQLIGQGDNQVLRLFFRPDADMRQELIRILASLSIEADLLDHVVKPDECVDSLTVLTYSKDLYVSGVHVDYSLKFGSRLYTVDDNDIPSLSGEIANACAGSIATADHLPLPLSGLLLQNFRIVRTIREYYRSAQSYTLKNKLASIMGHGPFMTFLLTLPGSLGGLPIMSWGRYFMRGEVDDLSWDVAATIRLSKYIPTLSADLSLLIKGEYSPPDPDHLQLALDPKSIPIFRPKDKKHLVKESVSSELPSYNQNPQLRPLLHSTLESAGKRLLKDLTSMSPFYPQIAKDIFDCSLAGVREKLLGRFNMTRTVSSILQNSSFITQLENASEAILSFLELRYTKATSIGGRLFHPADSFQITQKLRSLWKLADSDIVISTQCPLSWDLTEDIVTHPCVSASCRTQMGLLRKIPGPYKPNYGTKTKQKRSDQGYKIYTNGGPIIDVKKLVLIASELKASGPLYDLLDDIVKSRCDWSLSTLMKVFPTVYGGTAAHRHDSMQHQYFGILGNRTVPSHLCLDSDRSGNLAGGTKDYPVVFQEFFLSLTQVFQTLDNVSSRSVASVGLLVPNVEPLPDKDPELTTYSLLNWSKIPQNPLSTVLSLRGAQVFFRPPKCYVPDAPVKLDPSSLIASFLFTHIKAKTYDTMAQNIGVIEVSDMIDLAEFNGISTYEFMRGCAVFTLLESLYHATRFGNKVTSSVLGTVLRRVASSISGPIARLLMVKNGAHQDRYVSENMLISNLGTSGADNLGKRVQGHIVFLARKLLASGTYLDGFKWYVFQDSPSSGIKMLRRISLGWLVSLYNVTHEDRADLLKGIKRMLDDSSRLSQNADSYNAYFSHITLVRLEVEDIKVGRHKRRNRSLTPDELKIINGFEASYPNFQYVGKEAKEALRTLRGRSIQPLPPTITEVPKIKVINRGIVKLQQPGEILADTKPSSTRTKRPDESSRMKALTYSWSQRRDGIYSSALSLWHSLLSKDSDQFAGSEGLVIGVGHGATAAAALLLGASNVFGLDLRNSLPLIPHRETSWVPPEVENLGLSTRFSLHPSVFSLGGDITSEQVLQSISDRFDWIILDVDKDLPLHVYQSLAAKTPLLLTRAMLTSEEVSYLDSSLTCTITNLGFPLDGSDSPFFIRSVGLRSLTGTYLSAPLNWPKPYRYLLKTNREVQLKRLNLLLKPTGLELADVTRKEIERMVDKLTITIPMVKDLTYVTSGLDALDVLDEIKQRFDLSPHSLAHDLWESTLSRKILREVVLFFSNRFDEFPDEIAKLAYAFCPTTD